MAPSPSRAGWFRFHYTVHRGLLYSIVEELKVLLGADKILDLHVRPTGNDDLSNYLAFHVVLSEEAEDDFDHRLKKYFTQRLGIDSGGNINGLVTSSISTVENFG